MTNGSDSEIDRFRWDSEDQRKGYLSLVQYLRNHGVARSDNVDAVAAFFIQKDHESAKWFVGLLAEESARLRQEIQALRSELGKT